MPAPVAKGIIITVSALVAAGIAVYQSPQFQQWMTTSRRKIAVALHHLGDEIQPGELASPLREDISMNEEIGAAAQERRRMAREEIQRRSTLLRRKKEGSGIGSFDNLVDEEGRLRDPDADEKSLHTLATSTAVDLAPSPPVQRAGHADGADRVVDSPNRDRLHIDIPSSPGARSATLVEFTPTSDDSAHGSRPEEMGQSAFFSITSDDHSQASHTLSDASTSGSQHNLRSPFADLSDLASEGFTSPVRPDHPSSTSSIAGSYSHVYETAEDASSDGTLSDLGRSTHGVPTPASWSEVGSVISDEDASHHL